ncbi:hypothetical protein P691DRAFT_761699 [Macrolepiota fuliginosa MF-IS2]|uniref:Uncharacterized protein n=1 Tax=Macrolepiota fuliginosa MF-IS2 TaxID=1400762 RepID=A0A9P6C2H9_9AGAR|nr:hypothetical protein P691DRAFT_761699 [Macrolepiota fuliginosa MF-IS2]
MNLPYGYCGGEALVGDHPNVQFLAFLTSNPFCLFYSPDICQICTLLKSTTNRTRAISGIIPPFESLLRLRSGEDVCDGGGNSNGSSMLDASESEAETRGEDVDVDEEMTSPVLMHAKDGPLLKDVRKRKRKHADAVVGPCSVMGVEDAPAPASVFVMLQLTTIEAETQLLLPTTTFPEQTCQLPSKIITITATSPTDPSPQSPAQISILSTPTIGPSVNEQLDEDTISALRVMYPTVPLMVVLNAHAAELDLPAMDSLLALASPENISLAMEKMLKIMKDTAVSSE